MTREPTWIFEVVTFDDYWSSIHPDWNSGSRPVEGRYAPCVSRVIYRFSIYAIKSNFSSLTRLSSSRWHSISCMCFFAMAAFSFPNYSAVRCIWYSTSDAESLHASLAWFYSDFTDERSFYNSPSLSSSFWLCRSTSASSSDIIFNYSLLSSACCSLPILRLSI